MRLHTGAEGDAVLLLDHYKGDPGTDPLGAGGRGWGECPRSIGIGEFGQHEARGLVCGGTVGWIGPNHVGGFHAEDIARPVEVDGLRWWLVGGARVERDASGKRGAIGGLRVVVLSCDRPRQPLAHPRQERERHSVIPPCRARFAVMASTTSWGQLPAAATWPTTSATAANQSS